MSHELPANKGNTLSSPKMHLVDNTPRDMFITWSIGTALLLAVRPGRGNGWQQRTVVEYTALCDAERTSLARLVYIQALH